MWNNIKINNDVYMISVEQKDDTIKVVLTNLIELWIETLTDEIILDKCQKLNPLLNIEAFNHKETISNILNNVSKYIDEASVECIKLKAQIGGGTMKFAINLSKGTPEDFWEMITKPLCISSMEIARQHKFLVDLIKKKDEEIAEYKAEGAELIRNNIETKPFIEKQLKIDIPMPNITDYTSAFQSMVKFYSELNLGKESKISTELTSGSSRKDKMQKVEQNIINSAQDNKEGVDENMDVIIERSTEAINSESEVQRKTATKKKAASNRIGTANIEYKPSKKLKEELEHLPEKLPRRDNKRIKRRRCRECFANGMRKETNYFCPGCKDNPGLCLGKCFKEYHELVNA